MKVLSLDDAGQQAHDYLQSLLDDAITLTADEQTDDFDVLIAGRLSKELLRKSSQLKRVILPWAGIPASFRDLLGQPEFHHITLHNSHYNAPIVAEFAVTLLLTAMKCIPTVDRKLRQGDWRLRYAPSRAFSFRNKTALILGYGAIGRKTAHLLYALNFNVLATRNSISELVEEDGITICPQEQLAALLPKVDALILALPLTEATRGVIGTAEIATLPNTSIIVNVGRGQLVDEQALFTALKAGELHAAALDVWYQYPKDEQSRATTHPSSLPFYELDNVIMTPHVSSALADEEDLYLRMDDLADMLNTAVRVGQMHNQVDLVRGY